MLVGALNGLELGRVSGTAPFVAAGPPLPAIPSDVLAIFDVSYTPYVTVEGGGVAAIRSLVNGHVIAQPNASQRPDYVASGINGLPSMNCPGNRVLVSTTGDLAAALSSASNPTMTVFTALYYYSYSPGQYFLHLGGSASLYYRNDYDQNVATFVDDTGAALQANAAIAVNAPLVVTMMNRGDALFLWQNGGLLVGVGATVGPSHYTGSDMFGGLYGYVCEQILYNRALSDVERAQVENHLRTKWGTG